MKKQLIVPKFDTEDEERDFWANIDLSEYLEPKDFQRILYPNLKSETQPVSIRLPVYTVARLKEKANKLSVPYQALVKMYIEQGLIS